MRGEGLTVVQLRRLWVFVSSSLMSRVVGEFPKSRKVKFIIIMDGRQEERQGSICSCSPTKRQVVREAELTHLKLFL